MPVTVRSVHDIQNELAARFKARRLALNLTREGLAIRAGVTPSSLTRFERTGLIALESLLKLALVLECLDDFDRVCTDDGRGLANRTLDELLATPKLRGRGRIK